MHTACLGECLGDKALTEFLFQRHVDLFHGLVQNEVELRDWQRPLLLVYSSHEAIRSPLE